MKKITILISFLLFFSLFSLPFLSDNVNASKPVVSNSVPLNNSIDNPLAFNWYCDINESNGYNFNFTIELSDGQNASGNITSNLTTFIILTGLSYSTNYTVWVNTTQEINTSKYIFYFTTIDQPVITPTDFNALIMGLAITMLIVFLLFIIYELMFVDNKMPFIQKIMICIFVMVLIVIAVGVIASFI